MLSILDSDALRNIPLGVDSSGPSVNIGMLDALVRAHIADGFGNGTTDHVSRTKLVLHAVKGWKDVTDPSGVEIPFETEDIHLPGIGKRKAMSEKCLNRLSQNAITKISDEVIMMNFLTGEAEKN